MVGFRFVVCGNKKEIEVVTRYLKEVGRKFIIGETCDVSSLQTVCPEMTVIWYNGSIYDQYKICELTGGESIYEA